MYQTSEDPTQETSAEPEEQPTCPLCRSPLIGEAIENGKCQCCGHRFERQNIPES